MDKVQLQRDALAAEIERDLADGHLDFPTFLDVPLKIQRVLEQENAGLDELVPLIQIEPVLAARVVGLANSVLFGVGREPAKDLRAAVMRIGTAAVRSLALVVSTSQLTRGERLGAAQSYAVKLWDHSIDVAAWCYALATKVGNVKPEEAMLAGLLHDIGQFYLLAKAADYPELLDRETELSDLILVWHKPVGRAVLQSLGVPLDFQDAIDDREIYGGAFPLNGLADVLFIANLAAEEPNPLTLVRDQSRGGLLEAATVGIDQDAFEQITSEAAAERSRVLAALRA